MEKANKLTETIPGWVFKRIKTVDFSYNNFTWESSSSLPTKCDRGSVVGRWESDPGEHFHIWTSKGKYTAIRDQGSVL
ncbi:hypothetical protein ABKV19_026737 [Rosa sericea]